MLRYSKLYQVAFNSFKYQNCKLYSSNASIDPLNPIELEFRKIQYNFFSPDHLHVFVVSSYFEFFSNELNLSWGSSVVLGTFILKCATTIPAEFIQLKNRKKEAIVQKTTKEAAKKIYDVVYADVHAKPDVKKQKYINTIKRIRKDIYAHYKYHPLKGLGGKIIQFPLWLTSTYAIRSICGFMTAKRGLEETSYTEVLRNSEFLWLSDLLSTSLSIPFLLYGVLLFNSLFNHYSSHVIYSKRVLAVSILMNTLLFSASFYVPTIMSIFWLTSAATHSLILVGMASPRYKKAFDLFGEKDSNTPYKDAARKISAIFSRNTPS